MEPIYLDSAASSPLAPEAREAMLEALTDPGNPGSTHRFGRAAARRVSKAREQVADLMAVGPRGVVFTSTATEANNLALTATTASHPSILTSPIEHPSISVPAEAKQARLLSINSVGEVDLQDLRTQLTDDVGLVSIQAANNETGVMQDIEKVASIVSDHPALLHVDASQLAAWGTFDAVSLCDMITISSHKMYGPQGAAALIVRGSKSRERLRPSTLGGGQESGLRSGTVNVAAVAGFGAAAELSRTSGAVAAVEVAGLRDALLNKLWESIPGIFNSADGAARVLPNILNVVVGAHNPDSPESDVLLARTPMVAASTGSACHSGAPGPSPTLLRMGLTDYEARRSIRLSLSRYTTLEEVTLAAGKLGHSYATFMKLMGH